MNKDKKLEFYADKITNGCTDLEQIVYSEAIRLINSDVNHDKVSHWVNKTIHSFNNKPQPLSDKEKQKRELKKNKKQQKVERFKLVNAKMGELLEEYGVLVIGFFDWKKFSESESNMLSKLVEKYDYFYTDDGDGAYTPFVTKKEINNDFLETYEELSDELYELSHGKETVKDEYFTMEVEEFRDRIMSLV